MKNPSAIGVSILVLIAATTMVGSSAADGHYAFQGSQKILSKVIASTSAQTILRSYQERVDRINLNQAVLNKPHLLSVKVSPDTNFKGQISINEQIQIPISSTSPTVDISPYLTATKNRVILTGSYIPDGKPVTIDFAGPDTLVQQQLKGSGQINYQLDLVVESGQKQD